MRFAIYARKSTEQYGDAEQKSVARQIDNARAWIAARGGTVAEDHVYADDAVSGAEVRKLVNRRRLWDAFTTPERPPVDGLVMRDDSRFSRRDGEEAFRDLKRLASTGLAIFFYGDGSQFRYGTFGDNVVGFVRAEMNAEYRRKISVDTKEAHVRKFQAGHVVGGKCFGYDIVPVNGHKERRINEAEAEIVRRIFARSAAGDGYTRLAKDLTADGAVTPTPGTPWSPSTILTVLRRPLYRGEVVWNKTRRRAADGTETYARRPESEWLRIEQPALRIVDDATWHAVHARLGTVRARLYRHRPGPRRGVHDGDSPYMLAGFTRCAVCGGSLGVVDKRAYACIASHKRGTCTNKLRKRIDDLDHAVVAALRKDVLKPHVVRAIIREILAALAPPSLARDREQNRKALAALDTEIAHLTTAIAQGGLLPPLLAALTERQAARETLSATLAAQAALDGARLDRDEIERKVLYRLSAWTAKLDGDDLGERREALRELLDGPIPMAPTADGGYQFEGRTHLGRLIVGEIGGAQLIVRARQGSNLQPLAPEANALSS